MRLLDLPPELRALVDLLEDDDRPSAILNIEQPGAQGGYIVYQNGAFDTLRLGRAAVESLVLDLAHLQSSQRGSAQAVVADRSWRHTHIRHKWASIVCVNDPAVARNERPKPALRDAATEVCTGQPSDSGIERMLDWTRSEYTGPLSEYAHFMRTFDWGATALGPMETWPFQLRQYVVLICANPCPRVIVWGSDRLFIHNEAAAPLFGKKHPVCLGQPLTVHFVSSIPKRPPHFHHTARERTAFKFNPI